LNKRTLSLVLVLFVVILIYATYPFILHDGYVVLLTDLHYPYKSKTVEGLMNEVVQINPKGVFLLGDLTEMGSEQEFKKLSQLFLTLDRAKIPYRYVFGNHDVRWSDKLRKSSTLSKDSNSLYETFAVQIGNLLFIGLDTTMYFQHIGHIGEVQLNWLKERLEEAKKNGLKVILLSHHPFGGPKNYTDDGWKVLEIMPNYDIPLVLSGHVHTYEHSGMYNWSWFQTLGAAKDGYMTVLSWDKEQLYIWKYELGKNDFELLKSVPLELSSRQLINLRVNLERLTDGFLKLKAGYIGAERIRITANGKIVHERKIEFDKDKYKNYEVVLNNLPKTGISTFLRISLSGKFGVFQKFYIISNESEENRKILWSYKLNNTIYSKPVSYNDGVVVADYSGYVVYLRDGKEIWKRIVGPVVANLEIINNEILVGDLNGNIYLFEIETGRLLKSVKLTEPIYAIRKGDTTISIGAGKYLFVLRTSDLSLILKYDLEGLVQIPALFESGKYFQPTWSGKIYIIDEISRVINQFIIGKTYYTAGSSIPSLIGNLLIYANTDGTINCLNIEKKEKEWTLKISGVGYTPVKKHGNSIYASTINGEIYKIDGISGKTIWSAKIGSSITLSSLNFIDEELLVVGTDNGEVAIINSETGTFKKFFVAPGYVTDVIPLKSEIIVIMSNGNVYGLNFHVKIGNSKIVF